MAAPLVWLKGDEFLAAGGVLPLADGPTNRCFLFRASGTPVFREISPLGFARRWRQNSECRPRANHSTTLLADGRVLVVGGHLNSVPLRFVDLYDPTTDRWTSLRDLETARSDHVAGATSPSSVLVCGGQATGPWFEVVSVPP